MKIPGLVAAQERAAVSKTVRHVLTAVLAWSLCMLTAAAGALVWLTAAGKIDMASGTTLAGLVTAFAGVTMFVLRAIAGGVRMAQASADAADDAAAAAPGTEPPPSGGDAA